VTRLRIAVLMAVALPATNSQTVRYTYDAAGRLIRADYGDGKSITYSYDAAGNLLKREMSSRAAFVSLSSASFERGQPLAAESIVAGYGSGLATGTAVAGEGALPTELLGTRVEVTDSRGVTRRAPLFFVSPGQINYLVPAGTAVGTASILVTSGSGASVAGVLEVARVAPGLFTANNQGKGVASAFSLRVAADGSRTQALIFNPGTLEPVPIGLGQEGDQVFLLLFGTGIRGYQSAVMATLGGVTVPVLGAVPQGQYPGLDQVNAGPIPRELAGRGRLDLILTVDGKQANTVVVHIQ